LHQTHLGDQLFGAAEAVLIPIRIVAFFRHVSSVPGGGVDT